MIGKRESGDVVPQFQKGVPVGETGDFRVQHQRLDLALDAEIIACPKAGRVCLPQPLDLDFADSVRYPLGGLRLRDFQEYLGGRLRQHDLGQMTVDHLKLGLALKTEY